MSDDGMDLLLGGAPAAKFPNKGDVVRGKVLGQKKQQSRDMATGDVKTFDNGDPMWEIVFTLATDERDPEIEDDDGTRRVFARNQMLNAIGKALREAKWSRSLVGGTLAVKYHHDGEVKKRGFNPPKVYVAKFEPPDMADELDAVAAMTAASEEAAATYEKYDDEPPF